MSQEHQEQDLETKDVSYSPASEKETEVKQNESPADSQADTKDQARVLPGTGGPDDQGDVDVSPEELNAPGTDFPGHA